MTPSVGHDLAFIVGIMALEVVCILASIAIVATLLEVDSRWTVTPTPETWEAPSDD